MMRNQISTKSSDTLWIWGNNPSWNQSERIEKHTILLTQETSIMSWINEELDRINSET